MEYLEQMLNNNNLIKMYGKVKKQFEHAKSTNDDICKFNNLWISFNCFYNIKFNK
jgi:hypothetical protein